MVADLSRKTRCDAKLKSLAPADRAKIAAWLDEKSQADCAKLIAQDYGIEVAGSTLTAFYQWFHATRRLEEAATFADTLRADLASLPGLNLDSDQISKIGQALFEIQAVKDQDGKLFVALRKQRLASEAQRLEREKFEEARRRALQADEAEQVTRSELSPEEKDRRLRAIFGMA